MVSDFKAVSKTRMIHIYTHTRTHELTAFEPCHQYLIHHTRYRENQVATVS